MYELKNHGALNSYLECDCAWNENLLALNLENHCLVQNSLNGFAWVGNINNQSGIHLD